MHDSSAWLILKCRSHRFTLFYSLVHAPVVGDTFLNSTGQGSYAKVCI